MNRLLTGARKLTVYRAAILVVVVTVSLAGGLRLVQSQDPAPAPQNKEGKTNPTLIVPGATVNAGEVVFQPDTDHDGMNDAEEAENGTDPNNPEDADSDADDDGLTNGDEVAGGSNVNNSDTDGDGVADGEEVNLGYNPNDANSTPPPNAALASLQVSPNPINLTINPLVGQEPLQLRVTGVRTDGTTSDLTGSPTLTFESLNPNVALVDSFGNTAAVNPGTTTIVVSSGAISLSVPVEVTLLTPGPLAELSIPGFANNVDVAGEFAYVAAGSAGLVVVDVSDKTNPFIAATLNTAGNANDVRVVGTTAYVADGASGLQIIDVSTPSSPSFLGSLNTPGDASDVVVYNNRAYVADGVAGVRIIDVTNPAAPTTIGTVDTPGSCLGVDVSGDWIVIADASATRIIDAAIPESPTIVGSVGTTGAVTWDLEVRHRLAYVATSGQGLQLIDFTSPTMPRIVSSAPVFNLLDVAVRNRFAFGADSIFNNFVPIWDVGDPGSPTFLTGLTPTTSGSFRGTGLAVTGQHAYLTAANFTALNNGTGGITRLFILEYQAAANPVIDNGGIAPTVLIDSPQSGQSATEGDPLPVSIFATDDVRVASVQLIVNGIVVAEDSTSPYNITSLVPRGPTSMVIEARAFDTAGNSSTSPPVTINVTPDPPPTISIIVPEEGQILFERHQLFIFANANDNRPLTQVAFTVNGSPRPNFSFFTVPVGITSVTFVATATDDFGQTASTTRTVSVVPDPAPLVSIISPAQATQLFEEQVAEFIVDATDNFALERVDFDFNGDVVSDFEGPYRQVYTIPTGITSFVFAATGVDGLGQTTVVTRTFSVVPDPGTTATGRVLDTAGEPIAGATAQVGQLSAQTGADGRFTIPNLTGAQDVLVRVTATISGQSAANASLPTPRVPGGTTDVGDIILSVLPTAPTAFVVTDFTGDFIADVFVGYPDRQSLIYTVGGSEFTPSTGILLPYGAVSSGANLDLNFGTQHQLITQLTGRPGSVTEVAFDNGTTFSPRALATGLSGESEYTAVGVDADASTGDFRTDDKLKSKGGPAMATIGSSRSVLAFLSNGAGGTSLTVRFGDDSQEGFESPVTLPVDSSQPLRSLSLADVNNDGRLDVLVVKPDPVDGAKLVVYPRTSDSSFGSPVESAVTTRATMPARGAVDFVIGKFVGDSDLDIAVVGDGRVRIYEGDATGTFTSTGEIVVPTEKIITGLATIDLTQDGNSDIVITTSDATTPTDKEVRVYVNTDTGVFLSPEITTYVGPITGGDTRIGIGDWGGDFRRSDAVVVDSDALRLLLDIGPQRSGS